MDEDCSTYLKGVKMSTKPTFKNPDLDSLADAFFKTEKDRRFLMLGSAALPHDREMLNMSYTLLEHAREALEKAQEKVAAYEAVIAFAEVAFKLEPDDKIEIDFHGQ